MKEILTEELLKELLSRPKVDSFLNQNQLQNETLAENLNKLLIKHNLQKKDVVHACNLNETHVYQIFQGSRKASRNKILQLAFAMELNLKETNNLLHAAGVSSLYCKNRRDAIIIFAINKKYSLQETEDTLYKFGEDTLSKA